MRSAFFLMPFVLFCLAACAHEAENTGFENSSVITLPAEYYAFEDVGGAPAATARIGGSRAAGSISRYQRHVIVTNTASNPYASPQGQYFDDVMDHLETLMAPQIAENNRIALMQEQIPGYEF